MIIAPSKKLQNVSEYFFATANTLIREVESKSNKKVVNLGIGSPDLPPPPGLVDQLIKELADPINHRYPSYVGDKKLRTAVADYYRERFGVRLDPTTDILPLIGSKEGITHISLAFLNPRDEVLVPNPGYPTYSAGAILAQGVPKHYILSASNKWLPDLDELENMDLSRVKIWWLNYPHNPTGTLADLETMKTWVKFAKRHRLLLVFDNPYADIFWGSKKPASIFEVPGARDVAIELNSLSKTYNIAGWRIGMAIGKPDYIETLIKVKSNIDTGIFPAIQKAAAFALTNTDPNWIQKRNAVYQERRNLICKELSKTGLKTTASEGTLYVWAQIPKTAKPVAELSLELIKNHQVFVTPGTAFGSAGSGYIRISLCCPTPELQEGVKRMASYFENM